MACLPRYRPVAGGVVLPPAHRGSHRARGDVPGDAGYVHGLAIRRDFAGKGLGREFLRWAEDRVAASGKKYLRLDCAAENRALNEYYRRAGFSYRGEALVWGLEVSLYEKKVGVCGAG